VSTLRIRGATLDFDVTGDDGPLVVQLHGLMSSRRRDSHLGLDLGRALRDHRILRIDARGHGGSTGTDDPVDYRWDNLAEDLLAVLDAVAPGEAVHGVGPSMGTGTMLHAALKDPARFASLTLMVPPTAWGTRRAQAEVDRTNADLIERIDSTPDTVITLVDGKKYVVAEPLRDLMSSILRHRAEVVALSSHIQVGDLRLPADTHDPHGLVPEQQALASLLDLHQSRPSLSVIDGDHPAGATTTAAEEVSPR